MTKRRPPADSLDLLLDTICNTFGGVLFIAILVIILLQLSGPSASNTSLPMEIRAAQQLSDELDALNSQLDRLRDIQSIQGQTLSSLAPESVRELIARMQQLLRHCEESRDEADRLKEDAATAAADITELARQEERLREQLRAAEQRISQTEREIEFDRQRREIELRTPVLRPPGARGQVVVIVQYDRFYLWHEYDSLGLRRGLNTADFLLLEGSLLGHVTTPNPVKGIPLDGSPESVAAMTRELTPFSPDRHYVAAIVRPDSYDSFSHFRDVAVKLGFEYQLVPAKADDEYVDRGGSGGRVQ